MRWTAFLLVVLLLLPVVSADKEGSITLLTVTNNDVSEGGTADLQLVIKSGSGSIFFDSLPLTKLDTQISTRYANQIACQYVDEDCSKYDFFYRIRADSNIVGGPSAGAAMTVLTVALLTDTALDADTVITGTINSGGLIGPVAGISAKAAAAEREGFKRVLVPEFEIPVNTSNQTVFDVDIIKVGSLDEALWYFTGEEWNHVEEELIPPDAYIERMEYVADQLCSKSALLERRWIEQQGAFNDSRNYTTRAIAAGERGEHYAEASLCFSKNLQLRQLLLENASAAELLETVLKTRAEITDFEEEVDARTLKTISDLETYIIVKERLRDAWTSLDFTGEENVTPGRVGYAMERLSSAETWSVFFDMEGREISLDRSYLLEACQTKIGEAEERINYVNLYFPSLIGGAADTLSEAYEDVDDGAYALCLFRASKAKAEANILASVIGLDINLVNDVVDAKLEAVEKQLIRQQRDELFPLLGYSYWEYAGSLLAYDDNSALTFAEYALEMGNLAVYFPQKKTWSLEVDTELLMIYLSGLGTGFVAAMLFFWGLQRKKRSRK